MSVYVCSDLHGSLWAYQKIKKFIDPADAVIFLGDAGDRGPQSWNTIKAIATDPQFIYLMGNHEHILAGAMCEYVNDSRRRKIFLPLYQQNMTKLCISNGGSETLNSWIAEGADSKWIDFFLNLPLKFTYQTEDYDFICTHAGYTADFEQQDLFDKLWNREHFFDKWYGKENEIQIHGHTPAPILAERLNEMKYFGWTTAKDCQYSYNGHGAIWYCNDHKICIDCGTAFTNECTLINLDTLDEHLFKAEKEDD